MEDLKVQEDLTYIEKPTQILETADRVTRRSTIQMCKVKWGHLFLLVRFSLISGGLFIYFVKTI
jgi:hypothetical protein